MIAIIDTPDELMYLGLNWKISPKLHWNMGAKSVAGRKRTRELDEGGARVDPRAPAENYIAVSTRLAWHHVLPGLTIAASINNLTDDYLSEPGPQVFLQRDLPGTGRAYKAEIKYEF